jgi:NAD-dependent SIR2 family protein deacetylase
MSGAHWHGSLGEPHWSTPECVTTFDVAARDYCDERIMAHEYCESEETLAEKVAILAGLIRSAKGLVAFTGAGISTAAGIDDYASKAKEASVTAAGRPVVKDWKLARPTHAHRVLAAMHDSGHLHHWVQQNHDSLPQKAGYPQHAINEIHGSLHDPANPIVPYEGSLRDDLFGWLHEWQRRGDLVLALGTSLSGFNVDSVAQAAANKAARSAGLGLVIVNLQRTPYDDECSLRIFARCDDVLDRLAHELDIAVRPMDAVYAPRLAAGSQLSDDVVRVPFDAINGEPCDDPERWATWDLRVGRRVRLTGGPYAGDVGRVMEKSADGSYRIRFEDSVHPTFNVKRRPFSLWLGPWWLEAATHGHGIVPGGRVPLVNVAEGD